MIRYTESATSIRLIAVHLDGKKVGVIRPDPAGGYFYKPINGTACGETLPTIAAVKATLEDRS